MFSFEMIMYDLSHTMSKKRFNHTCGVIETSERLAGYYGVDHYKAKMEAVLHDCSKTKDMTEDQMSKMAARTEFPDKFPSQIKGTNLLHALASEVLAREKYGITDIEILSAVRWHTTGCKDMNKLDMLIYSADMIEPSRKFGGVDELRNFMFSGIEKLTFECVKHTVRHLKDTRNDIHQSTLDAYNYLKKLNNLA